MSFRQRVAALWRRLGFRDALVLSAPAVLLVGYLLVAAAVDYYRAIQFEDYFTESASVEQQFRARAGMLLRLLPALTRSHHIDPERDDPGIVRLQIDPPLLDSAYDDPQLRWSTWMKGTLLTGDGRLQPVDVKKRGDNSVHWLTEKKTLTVRTTRDDFYKRYRSFGLSAKDVLPAYVINRLAREFDLMAPSTRVVPVVLNNEFAGMYRFVEPVDESFLRPFDRMPGNIFRGDAAERGEYFKGMPRDLFGNPYIWDRVAANDRPTSAGPGQLRLFIEDVNADGFAAHQRLMGRLDRDELARLMAYLLLVGDPYHMDGVHNQLWYEDPSTSLLHPIPWDVRLMRLEKLPAEGLNAMLRAVLRDPWLVDGTLAELQRRLADGAWLALADSLARGAWNRYHDEFLYDSLRGPLIPRLGHPDEVHRVLQGNARVLRGWLENAEVAFAGTTVLDFESRGFAGVTLDGLEVVRGERGARPVLRMDRNRNGVLDAEDPAVAGDWTAGDTLRFVPSTPLPLLASWRAGQPWLDHQPGLAPGAQHYRFFLVGAGHPAAVRPALRNRYTGAAVVPRAWAPDSAIAAATGFSPWQYPVVPGRLHRLAGQVHLAADLKLTASDTLIIEPGTTIRLDPDVSIVSRGRVIAAGTAARPILITRADSTRPWGAFALQGPGADSSRFSYVTFEWGGGALVDRVEYIGMVNLHRTRGVQVEHSVFRDNVRSDDTFHALHSQFTLRNSEFLRTNSDAVDLDISSGLIEANSFESTGGDAIDLMTSTPVVRDNRIRGSGDKGISVGEASSPIILGNRIESSKRGIEIKDRSDPLVLSNFLSNNGVGLYEDRKNWRYGGGGWGTIINTPLGANVDSLHKDSYSRITFSDDTLAASYRAAGVAALASAQFEEDFDSMADGWVAGGGTTRLVKVNRALYAAVEQRPGRIGTRLNWDLRGSAGPGALVLEMTSHQLDSAEVLLLSPEGDVRFRLGLSNDPAVFRLTTLKLPARRYTAMLIVLTPEPRIEKRVRDPGWTELKPAQFWLRGYTLYGAGTGPARKPAS